MVNIFGNAYANVLIDTAGDDDIRGYGGDDQITVTSGIDVVAAGSDTDTLTISWANATQNTTVYGGSTNYSFGFVDTAGTGLIGDSIRRVNFSSVEHLNVFTGSGNDQITGVRNRSDTINAGAGVDHWIDIFDSVAGNLNVNMQLISSGLGQILSDGSNIKNVERVSLTLTQQADIFRDFGAFDDVVNGNSGNDDLGTSNGIDVLNGNSGVDTITIDWSNATQDATVYGASTNYSSGFVDTAGNGLIGSSTRRVNFSSMEHLDVTTGSGNDKITGVSNSTDTLDGGAGNDQWVDNFSSLATAVSINMQQVSSGVGQVLSDGTSLKNIEFASLTLTDGNDIFRDFGAFNDVVNGHDNDDNLGTSDGIDILNGNSGVDTITIDWSNATQDATVYAASTNYSSGFVDTADDGLIGSSSRRVNFSSIEHLDVITGSGNDKITGVSNSADTIDGGAGNDQWVDSFNSLATAVSIDLQQASSGVGQVLSDGTSLKNIEFASLTLTDGNDTFRDFGTFNDVVNGHDNDDNLGTTDGIDILNGNSGIDTITIDWSTATQDTRVYAASTNYSSGFVDTADDGLIGSSTRRVNFSSIEHIDVKTGSGNDEITGVSNQTDVIDAGTGNDQWLDSFSSFGAGISIDMQLVSSGTGQVLIDGSFIKNIEFANLTLTQQADIFRDFGAFDDVIDGQGGDDNIGTSDGIDVIGGNSGVDTITIDWSSATQDATVFANSTNYSSGFVDTGEDGLIGSSSRRVNFSSIEHIDVKTGSGDDTITGVFNSADVIDGGAGNDLWIDSFSDQATAVSIDMQQASSAGGQILSDGTSIKNIEFANLTLSNENDTYRDFGVFNDNISGDSGNDDLGTSDGIDVIDGSIGDDTITIDWSSATQDATVFAASFNYSSGFVDTAGSGTIGASSRRVNFSSIEHLDARTGSGNDTITGTSGSDIIAAGAGNDTIYAGGGIDTVVFDFASTQATITDMGSGVLSIVGPTGTDTLTDVEFLQFTDGLHDTSGATLLVGNEVANVLIGTPLSDVMSGNGGDDIISGLASADTLNGDAGDDVLFGGNGADTLNGGLDNDTLHGGLHNDTLNGDAGDDILIGDGGNDTLDGGADSDTVDYSSAGSAVNVNLATAGAQNTGGGGADTLISIENATGSDFNDTLTGDGNANVLNGGAGNDALNGAGGADTLNGGDDNDTLDGGAGADTLNGDGGDDILIGDADDDVLNGGTGFDTVDYSALGAGVVVNLGVAGPQNTVGAGTDSFSGIEKIIGTAFVDTLTGDASDNVFVGGLGGDSFNGGGGNDTVDYTDAAGALDVRLDIVGVQNTGGAGNESLNSIENLIGSNFSDKIQGSEGDNVLAGGAGTDTVSYQNIGGGVIVDLGNAGIQNTNNGGFDALSGFENLDGSSFGDTLTGTNNANIINGSLGNDTINGLGGNDVLTGGFNQDTLNGGDGDDDLDGGAGSDIIDGGAGIDTGRYDSFGGAIIINLNLTTAQNTGAAGTETISNVENLIGGIGNDRFTGKVQASVLEGGGGSDSLFGLGGDDILRGGDGNDNAQGGNGADTLIGGNGRDTLVGGNGIDTIQGDDGKDVIRGGDDEDIINGGAGRDVLIGGDFTGGGFPGDAAADIFIFSDVSHSSFGGATRDIIRDFEQTLDIIDLSAIDAITGGGDDVFTFIGTSNFSGTAGELRAFSIGGNTTVRADVDGDGAADMEIFLNGTIAMTAGDFVL